MSSEDILNAEGKIESVELAKEGTGSKGPWKLWKYKIGGKFYSGFVSLEEYKLKLGDYCIVAYKEKANEDPKKKPYKNIVNLTETVSQEEMVEEDKKVGMVPMNPDTCEEEPKTDYNFGAFFGMVSNQTMQFIIHQLKLNPSPEGQLNWSYQKKFSQVFEIIWEENIKKRKEKLK